MFTMSLACAEMLSNAVSFGFGRHVTAQISVISPFAFGISATACEPEPGLAWLGLAWLVKKHVFHEMAS